MWVRVAIGKQSPAQIDSLKCIAPMAKFTMGQNKPTRPIGGIYGVIWG